MTPLSSDSDDEGQGRYRVWHRHPDGDLLGHEELDANGMATAAQTYAEKYELPEGTPIYARELEPLPPPVRYVMGEKYVEWVD